MSQPETTDRLDNWITTAQASQELGLTQRRITQLISEGKLQGKQLSARMWLVSRLSVENYKQLQE